MIAIFVLYIHHKITEAEARVSGFSAHPINQGENSLIL